MAGGTQTNLKLTPEGRARLLALAKLTRRIPRDVVEILLAQAVALAEPDLALLMQAPTLAGVPGDGEGNGDAA